MSDDSDQRGWLNKALLNRSALSVGVQRLAYEKYYASIGIPSDVSTDSVTIENVPAQWVIPQKSSSDRFLYYVHGGGFAAGSSTSHLPYFSRLCSATYSRGLIIDYRRTPEFPFPAALHDTVAVFRWMFERHVNPSNIAIVGDGCGAGLALSTLLTLRKEGHPLPAAALFISPWVDLVNSNKTVKFNETGNRGWADQDLAYLAEMYVDVFNPADPLISPVNANLEGLPPVMIQASEREPLAPDAVLLAERLKIAGVDVHFDQYEGDKHSLPMYLEREPAADVLLQHAARFLSTHILQ